MADSISPGQLLMVGVDGPCLTREEREIISRWQVGGIVLFARNYGDPEQLSSLIREVRSLLSVPPFVAVDQEGGRVLRLSDPFTPFPAARLVGAMENEGIPLEMGRAMARELLPVGVNLNLAPVLDLDTNPKNPVIGDRSFGRDPLKVARMGEAMISGMQGEGLMACAKHFPGHGDTELDSHHTLPSVSLPVERLWQCEMFPFARAVKKGVACVMTAHVLYPALDPDLPATLSPAILGILRKEMGFPGMVLSDDLEMKGIAQRFSMREAVSLGLTAGVDLFLACREKKTQEEVMEALFEEADERKERVGEAFSIIMETKKRFLQEGPPDPAGARRAASANRALWEKLFS